jgi:hypothetical protein
MMRYGPCKLEVVGRVCVLVCMLIGNACERACACARTQGELVDVGDEGAACALQLLYRRLANALLLKHMFKVGAGA